MRYFDIKIKSVAFSSIEYEEMLALRNRILRHPLGRTLDEQDLAGEEVQQHFAAYNAEGELLACLCVKGVDATSCRIRQMCVRDGYDGRGLGRSLMQEVEQLLRAQGVRTLMLHARETAIGFYEKLGYECDGNIFDEVGIPHINMQKIIL